MDKISPFSTFNNKDPAPVASNVSKWICLSSLFIKY